MKPVAGVAVAGVAVVAPFTGAWIETLRLEIADKRLLVAPFTGAWIETAN